VAMVAIVAMAAGIRPTVTAVRPTAATAIRQETVSLKGDLAAALGELTASLGELVASALRGDSPGRPSLPGTATRASQGAPLACANRRWGDRSLSRSPNPYALARGILDDEPLGHSPTEHSFSPLHPPLPPAERTLASSLKIAAAVPARPPLQSRPSIKGGHSGPHLPFLRTADPERI
jgi:hypothetical protein